MQTRILSVSPEDSDREVAEIVNKYNLLAIPVVDEENRMKGVIIFKNLLEIVAPELGK